MKLKFLTVLILSGLIAFPAELQAQGKPNIIVLLADDLGWTDLGSYGSAFYETPNIDKLAENGIRFTNAYAACNVCSPTRAALMTGKYPARLHLTDWIAGYKMPNAKLAAPDWTQYLSMEETTIAELLNRKAMLRRQSGNGTLAKRRNTGLKNRDLM